MANTPKNKVAPGGIQRNVTRVLRMLMALREVDQREIAKAINRDPASVSRAFNGERKWSLDELELLGEVFECGPGYFLEPADKLLAPPIRSRCEPQLLVAA